MFTLCCPPPPRALTHPLTPHAHRGWLRDDEGRQDLPAILRTALEVAHGVEYLHGRAVIHGALHNGNVLLTGTGASTVSGMSRVAPSRQGSVAGGSAALSPQGSEGPSAAATPPGERAAGEDVRGFAAMVSRRCHCRWQRRPPAWCAGDSVACPPRPPQHTHTQANPRPRPGRLPP